MTKINSGKTAVVFPMERNGYANDSNFSRIFSLVIRIQSRAFIQFMNGTSTLSKLIGMARDLLTINDTTSRPQLFAAISSCFMEVFRWIAMLENLEGLLLQKKSAESLRQLQKNGVMPAKKLHVKIEWQDCVCPTIM